MKLLNLVGWSSMAIIPKTRQTKPTGVIINEHTLTASQTRLHVETLSRWFDFIHYDELLDRLSRPRSRPFCLLLSMTVRAGTPPLPPRNWSVWGSPQSSTLRLDF